VLYAVVRCDLICRIMAARLMYALCRKLCVKGISCELYGAWCKYDCTSVLSCKLYDVGSKVYVVFYRPAISYEL
jgi:hypothetical protein